MLDRKVQGKRVESTEERGAMIARHMKMFEKQISLTTNMVSHQMKKQMRRDQQIQPQSIPCADASENGWLKQKQKKRKGSEGRC
jgi:hypothetical protein